jgi:hypothetical protein
MPDRCVVFGCSNEANAEKGISLHRIPFWNDERPEAKRRRNIWVNFVATKRAKWTPSKFSAVCSEHFTPEDYEKYLVEIPGTRDYTPRLKKDETGVVVYPSKFTRSNLADEVSPRDKRRVCLYYIFVYICHLINILIASFACIVSVLICLNCIY